VQIRRKTKSTIHLSEFFFVYLKAAADPTKYISSETTTLYKLKNESHPLYFARKINKYGHYIISYTHIFNPLLQNLRKIKIGHRPGPTLL
jgi:hypothetical protein